MIFTTYRQYFKVVASSLLIFISFMIPIVLAIVFHPAFLMLLAVSCLSLPVLVENFEDVPNEIPDRLHMMRKNKYIIHEGSIPGRWREEPIIYVRLPFAWVATNYKGTMEEFVEKKVEYRHHIHHDSFLL